MTDFRGLPCRHKEQLEALLGEHIHLIYIRAIHPLFQTLES